MTKKLALTIAGAVSLGSYESGVAYELLDAISQHNQWADGTNQPDERIEIDVLRCLGWRDDGRDNRSTPPLRWPFHE